MSTERLEFYAFYGTLRLEMENYAMFSNTLIYINTVSLAGYRMYSLREYPYVVHTADSTDTIVVDLFRITSAQTEQMIYEMEIDAGYILSTVAIDGKIFGLYMFTSANPAHRVVPGGDWVKSGPGGSF